MSTKGYSRRFSYRESEANREEYPSASATNGLKEVDESEEYTNSITP
jgi:hypothetical protein